MLAVEQTLQGNTVKYLDAGGLPSLDMPKIRRNKQIEIIAINTGCLGSCTYCKTKHARGKLGSYPPEAIEKRLARAFSEGISEVWLTSEDTGAYGRDIGSNIAELLVILVNNMQEGSFMRIGMTNPPFMLEHMSAIVKVLNHPRVYSFLHIPV